MHNRGPVLYDDTIVRMMHEGSLREAEPDELLQMVNISTLRVSAHLGLARYRRAWAASQLDAICASVGVACTAARRRHAVFEDIAAFADFCTRSGFARIVSSTGTLIAAHRAGKRPIVLHIENPDFVRGIADLEALRRKGVAIYGLAYNHGSPFGAGCLSPADTGVTRLGMEFIRWANATGVAVDISHCSERASLQVIDLADRVTCTHSFRACVNGNPRGKSDHTLRALAAKGSVVGVPLHPGLIGSNGSGKDGFHVFCQHIISLTQLIGPRHVGIGTDWVGNVPRCAVEMLNAMQKKEGEPDLDWAHRTEGYDSISDWPNLIDALFAHGVSSERVEHIQGGSFLAWMRLFM